MAKGDATTEQATAADQPNEGGPQDQQRDPRGGRFVVHGGESAIYECPQCIALTTNIQARS